MKKIYFIFSQLLKNNGYKLPEQSKKERLFSDPNNAVITITNTLDFFSIKNIVATVPKTAINELPQSFIAQVNNNGNFYLVLACKKQYDKIKVYMDDTKSFIITTEEFLLDWTGLIIAIEKNEKPILQINISEILLKTTMIISTISLLIYFLIYTNSVFSTLYLSLSLVGLVISGFIIKEKLGFNSTTSRFCSLTKNTDCLAVLNSKEAKLFNIFDLSEISVIYFLFLSISFYINPKSIFFLVCSCLSLPIIAYSIIYQFFKIKKWCPLCLSIASVLALQFFVILPVYQVLEISYSDLFLFISISGVTSIGWVFMKPLLLKAKKSDELTIENLKFRRNYHLFLPYYNTLNKININPNSLSPIQIGSNIPTVIITAITNPLCKMCTEAHIVYMNMLEKHPNKIRIDFLFLVPNKDRNDVRTQISERLLQLYNEEKINFFREAFDDWYNSINAGEWLSKWGVCTNLKYSIILREQVLWCLSNKIDSTPIILINGKLFPETYLPSDIESFIDHIIECDSSNRKAEMENIHA